MPSLPNATYTEDGYPHSVLVIIPTYNEVDNLALILGRLRAGVPSAHVLVVDDNSPDGTGQLADDFARTDGRIHVLHRPGKGGLGAAYLAGFAWALNRDYDAVVEMDADGSHAPEELPRLLAALTEADLVLGSRWISGGSVHNWPYRRSVLSRAGNLYTRLALNIDLRDATGGYRVFRSQALAALDLHAVNSQGYCFQVELAWLALKAGFTLTEVPITFTEREFGESKMNGPIIAEALLNVTRWAIAHRTTVLRRTLTTSREPAAQPLTQPSK